MRPDNRNPSAGQEAQTARRKLFNLSLLHIANDLHAGVLPTIIPMLAQSISLTLAQAGALNSVFGILHIFCQPAFGFIADRQKKTYSAVIGPVLCAAGACLLPLAPSFGAAIFFVALLGTGTAMFHPQGTGLCGEAAGERNLAFFISIFAAFGTLGSAFGPVYVVYVVGALGRKGLPFMVLPVVLVCTYAFKNLVLCDNRGGNSAPGREGLGKFLRGAGSIISKIGGIIAIATLRDATNLGIRLFLPTLAILQGGTNKQGGSWFFALRWPRPYRRWSAADMPPESVIQKFLSAG